MERTAGILMPIFSLPSKYGIGSFSQEAYDFIDWLRDAGQRYWQILPLGPTSYGDSPYQSFSTYAGNPYFIDLDKLIVEGYLTKEECESIDFGQDSTCIDYEKLYYGRYRLLRKAYERANVGANDEFTLFIGENAWWLDDYAVFMAVKDLFDGKAWTEWPEDIRLRYGYSIDYYHEQLYYEIEFQKYMQFLYQKDWLALKEYSNQQGIQIIGDLPIYVALDSADVWANPQLFQLDEYNVPIAVAGCPPDGFAASGQLWGNPLYRWEYHKETGFCWWMERLEYCFQQYNILRMDHFRGFDAYYSIPYGKSTAMNGTWQKGPGMDLFLKMREVLGPQKVIAEDLGYLTDGVRILVADSGFSGMKVLEFAFDSRDSTGENVYLPHHYHENCVVYTGTHDNETLQGWLKNITKFEITNLREYMWDFYTPLEALHWNMICLAMRSNAFLCIVPIQDYLGLDNTARINYPSTVEGNWKWRITKSQLSNKLQKQIRHITKLYSRSFSNVI